MIRRLVVVVVLFCISSGFALAQETVVTKIAQKGRELKLTKGKPGNGVWASEAHGIPTGYVAVERKMVPRSVEPQPQGSWRDAFVRLSLVAEEGKAIRPSFEIWCLAISPLPKNVLTKRKKRVVELSLLEKHIEESKGLTGLYREQQLVEKAINHGFDGVYDPSLSKQKKIVSLKNWNESELLDFVVVAYRQRGGRLWKKISPAQSGRWVSESTVPKNFVVKSERMRERDSDTTGKWRDKFVQIEREGSMAARKDKLELARKRMLLHSSSLVSQAQQEISSEVLRLTEQLKAAEKQIELGNTEQQKERFRLAAGGLRKSIRKAITLQRELVRFVEDHKSQNVRNSISSVLQRADSLLSRATDWLEAAKKPVSGGRSQAEQGKNKVFDAGQYTFAINESASQLQVTSKAMKDAGKAPIYIGRNLLDGREVFDVVYFAVESEIRWEILSGLKEGMNRSGGFQGFKDMVTYKGTDGINSYAIITTAGEDHRKLPETYDYRGCDTKTHQKNFEFLKGEGYAPVYVRTYPTNSGVKRDALYVKPVKAYRWVLRTALKDMQYRKKNAELRGIGFEADWHFEYELDGIRMHSVLWTKR